MNYYSPARNHWAVQIVHAMFSNQHMVPHLKIHRHLTIHLPRRMSLVLLISSWMICEERKKDEGFKKPKNI